MKTGADATAIHVRGFWSASSYHKGDLPSEHESEKWIIFTSGMPALSEYFELSGDLTYMLTPEGRTKSQEYHNDTIKYKRLILQALDIYNEVEKDDDIALWEGSYSSDRDFPGALITSADEYYKRYSSNYGLSKGAFVKAMADDDILKRNTCFAIKELLEIRSVILYPNNRFTRFRKIPEKNISKENGSLGD